MNQPRMLTPSLEKLEEHILIATAAKCKVHTVSVFNHLHKKGRIKRHELRKLANQKHRDPLNATLREEYHAVLLTA